MTGGEALRFRTFGFLQYRQMLSSRETGALAVAFDLAMERAERHRPTPAGARQQVVPFFDYDPDAFYPLLDDERLVEVFETLLGVDYILVATAPPRRQRMLARAIELGFGSTGRITHLQDLR